MEEQEQLLGSSLSVGECFGDYEILDKLQEGCTDCNTYRATHRPTGDQVAIKIFLLFREKSRTLFETEVKSFQRVQGFPAILPLRDYGEKDGTYFVVTDFIKGGCLRDLLDQYPDGMDVQDVLRLFTPIADAIDYCHAMDLVHRDLKPANILLSKPREGFTPYITDFGIARIMDESRSYRTSTYSGTLPYSAPETFDHEATKTSAVDIYSLGVILYEALEGAVPFRDRDPLRMIELHKNAPVPYPYKIEEKTNPRVVEVLFRALAKNPEYRPKSAGRLMEDLRQAADTVWQDHFQIGYGKRIKDYVIENSLGVGRLSQTFLARDTTNQQQVVVKLFSTGNTREDAINSFQDEIKAFTNIRETKGVLQLLDSGEKSGMFYLVTKYMEEGSLRRYLDQFPQGMLIKDALRLFTCIAEAIDSIHQQGIVHRDLKPENIVLAKIGGELEPYLTDFGIARVLAGTQSFYTQNVTGTFRYMAPEAWDPGMKKTPSIDIYAFGVMLYEALEGEPPFDAEYPAIINQHVNGDIPLPERVSREYGQKAAAAVTRALAKKAEDRPKSALEIIRELEASIPGIEFLGERIGAYRITRFLRENWAGQTFEARDDHNGRRIAIRITPYAGPAGRPVTNKNRIYAISGVALLALLIGLFWFANRHPLPALLNTATPSLTATQASYLPLTAPGATTDTPTATPAATATVTPTLTPSQTITLSAAPTTATATPTQTQKVPAVTGTSTSRPKSSGSSATQANPKPPATSQPPAATSQPAAPTSQPPAATSQPPANTPPPNPSAPTATKHIGKPPTNTPKP